MSCYDCLRFRNVRLSADTVSSRVDSGVGVSDLVLTLSSRVDSGVGVSDLVLTLCLQGLIQVLECQTWC